LAERRLRLPDDLSLVALCYETWYEHLRPTITHYHSEPDTIARSLIRKILGVASNELKGSPQKLLIPECFEGQSVRRV
jgi:DNA-binding LacI/PurR family transcriptional regulator